MDDTARNTLLRRDLLDGLTASAQDQFGFILDPLHVALSGTCRNCTHNQTGHFTDSALAPG